MFLSPRITAHFRVRLMTICAVLKWKCSVENSKLYSFDQGGDTSQKVRRHGLSPSSLPSFPPLSCFPSLSLLSLPFSPFDPLPPFPPYLSSPSLPFPVSPCYVLTMYSFVLRMSFKEFRIYQLNIANRVRLTHILLQNGIQKCRKVFSVAK